MKNPASYRTPEDCAVDVSEARSEVTGALDGAGLEFETQPPLPTMETLDALLGLRYGGCVQPIIENSLLGPVRSVSRNSGKRFRAKLVEMSGRIIGGEPQSAAAARRLRLCADILEFIHAGSLIVDDIEDGSGMRRGRPALHVSHGLPIALNSGNWLYFWPHLLLKEARFSAERLLWAYEQCHRALLRAHFGQAVDLGTRVDALARERVPAVCLAAMELKTGALMGLATYLGGLAAGGSRRVLPILQEFGEGVGVGLQMFDDLGNVMGAREPTKRYEDLMLYRPSWVWALAAEQGSAADYAGFVNAVHGLPDSAPLEVWLGNSGLIEQGRRTAMGFMEGVFTKLEMKLTQATGQAPGTALHALRELGREIARSYE